MKRTKLNLVKSFPLLLTIGGLLGLAASLILSYDTLKVAENSNYVPSCNLNPVLSCGNVINAAGDKIFGLPFPYYGIAAFSVILTIGVAMLAGAKFKKWFWAGFQLVATLGLIGAYLLLLKSIYTIHALCPYCLSVDVVTTTLVWYLTLYNASTGLFKTNSKKLKQTYAWVRKHHLDLLILWFLIITALVIKHFWYYYGKHL